MGRGGKLHNSRGQKGKNEKSQMPIKGEWGIGTTEDGGGGGRLKNGGKSYQVLLRPETKGVTLGERRKWELRTRVRV